MKLAILTIAIALAGCGTTAAFDNVATCSLDRDRAFVASLYGPIGVTAEIRKQDAAVMCRP
jgi:hypothetical protein